MSFELLQKPVGTLDLLLYLLRHGKTAVTTILSDTGMNKATFYDAAERLRSLGFAYEDKQTGYPTYVYWGLTRAGEGLARTLGPAAELISATTAALERELTDLEAAGDPATAPRRLEILTLVVDRDGRPRCHRGRRGEGYPSWPGDRRPVTSSAQPSS